jgi:hypothetical protein
MNTNTSKPIKIWRQEDDLEIVKAIKSNPGNLKKVFEGLTQLERFSLSTVKSIKMRYYKKVRYEYQIFELKSTMSRLSNTKNLLS